MDKIEEVIPIMLHYKCGNCGNKCLQESRPNNSICGGCNNPDWKIMKNQESYMVGKVDWIYPMWEII